METQEKLRKNGLTVTLPSLQSSVFWAQSGELPCRGFLCRAAVMMGGVDEEVHLGGVGGWVE